MKKQLQASILASILLTPTILTPIAEAAVNPSVQSTQQTVAVKEQVIQIVRGLTEQATRQEVTLAQAYVNQPNELQNLGFTTAEITLLTAKVAYIDDYLWFRNNINDLGKKIKAIPFTHPTAVSAYEAEDLMALYTTIDGDMTATNQTYKQIVNVATPEMVSDFVGEALQYGNNPVSQKRYIISQGADIDMLERLDKVVAEAAPTMTLLDDYNKTTDLAASDDLAKQIRAAYNKASADAQTVIASYMPTGMTKPIFSTIAETEKLAAEAAKVEEQLNTVMTTAYKTPTEYVAAIRSLEAAYKRLPDLAKALVNKASIDALLEEGKFIDEVNKLRPSNRPDYRTKVAELALLGDSIQAINVAEVTKAKAALDNYEQQIATVAAIEEQIKNIKQIEDAVVAREAYNALTKDEQRIVSNIRDLSTWETKIKALEKLDTQIMALHPNDSSFASRTVSTQRTASKYSDAELAMLTYGKRLKTFLPIAELEQAVKKLKPTHYDYANELAKLRSQHSALINEIEEPNLKEATSKKIAMLDKQISIMEDEKKVAAEVVDKITSLNTLVHGDKTAYINTMLDARASYNELPSNARRAVTNIKELTTHEKDYRAVIRVITMINDIDEGNKNFTSKVNSAQKAYERLPKAQQDYVTNYAVISEALTYSSLIEALSKLRPTSRTYRDDVAELRKQYDALTTDKQAKVYNNHLLTQAEGYIAQANEMDKKIADLQHLAPEKMIEEVAKLSAEYKYMDKNAQRLVQNAKNLTDFERENKAVIKVVQLIQDLDPTLRDYTKRVTSARQAYDKLTPISKGRVTNYAKLLEVEPVAYLIGDIASLRPANKTFAKDVERLRMQYESLPSGEKLLITNLYLLEEAEAQLQQVAGVVELIELAISDGKHEEYMQRLTNARIAYDRLTSQQKRLVANQKDLTTHERAVKPVLDVMVLIDRIDVDMQSFVKDTLAARNAYGKLDRTQRSLVTNYERLQYYEPVATVTDLISKIKPTSKTYHVDAESARAQYDTLDDKRKELVPNIDILERAEKNIASAADIDDLIASLPTSQAERFVFNVAEARAVYDGLTPDRKRAVKNYPLLVAQEKIAKPVQQVVDQIDGIFTATSMTKQYQIIMKSYDKLDAAHRKYVYNANVFLTLTNVIKVHDKIASLNPSDPNYFGLVQLVRVEYNQLSSADKQRVTNYNKLLEAEAERTKIDKVMETIARISSSASSYFEQVDEAMAQYNSLTSVMRKHVINYERLAVAHKDVSTARTVINMISAIDDSMENLNFERQVLAAEKAYNALTPSQRRLINNAFLLEDYLKQL